MVWRTHLVIYFGTGDGNPSEIVKKIESIGFTSVLGPVDFTYEWGEQPPTKEKVLELADNLKRVLQGTGCVFNLDTHD